MDDTFYMLIKKEDWLDIVLNKELLLHISKTADNGYVVDLYKYNFSDQQEGDFITSTYAMYDDLHGDEE